MSPDDYKRTVDQLFTDLIEFGHLDFAEDLAKRAQRIVERARADAHIATDDAP
jgi:hypothetical protein